jgi:hypothetical protein
MTAKAGNEGKLFGSIGTADIAEASPAAGHEIERAEVRLPAADPHGRRAPVTLHLHADVDVEAAGDRGRRGVMDRRGRSARPRPDEGRWRRHGRGSSHADRG